MLEVVKLATRTELRASHESGIQLDLADFLRDVYELKIPDAIELPGWDPPGEEKCDVCGVYEFEAFDPDLHLNGPTPGPFPEHAIEAAAYYREQYRGALDLAYKLRKLAQELHEKLEAIDLEERETFEIAANDLSFRAHQLRVDLEGWGLPLPRKGYVG